MNYLDEAKAILSSEVYGALIKLAIDFKKKRYLTY